MLTTREAQAAADTLKRVVACIDAGTLAAEGDQPAWLLAAAEVLESVVWLRLLH